MDDSTEVLRKEGRKGEFFVKGKNKKDLMRSSEVKLQRVLVPMWDSEGHGPHEVRP